MELLFALAALARAIEVPLIYWNTSLARYDEQVTPLQARVLPAIESSADFVFEVKPIGGGWAQVSDRGPRSIWPEFELLLPQFVEPRSTS